MVRSERVGHSRQLSPWDRGRLALLVRDEADSLLRGVLAEWAAARESSLRGSTLRNAELFETDAKALIRHPSCATAIEIIKSHGSGAGPGDVEAAILSLYTQVAWERFGELMRRYVWSVASRLRPVLRASLRTIKLHMEAEEEEEEVGVPMSLFFFDSLRTCSANPNCFRTEAKEAAGLSKRPFGWSPDNDRFDTLLALLVMRQAGEPFRPKAFICSPLAYYLRAAGLATVVRVDGACPTCGSQQSGEEGRGECGRCGGIIVSRSSRRLLSTHYVEDVLRQAASADNALLPGQRMLERTAMEMTARRREMDEGRQLQEELDSTWRAIFGHARELWQETLGRNPPNPCELAVLFSLAGLDGPPAPSERLEPRERWVEQIVGRLLESAVPRETILQWAQEHMQEVRRECGTVRETSLSAGNVGRIICHFRRRLFREV